jgi:hypothetical protein
MPIACGITVVVSMGVSGVVPAGMPLSGPDTSPRDVRLKSASNEGAGSRVPDPLAVGLSGPLS